MIKHWKHTETVDNDTYNQFLKHKVPIKPSIKLPNNTAVFILNEEGGKRLEGVYDPTVGGIRPLKVTNAPNRDLRLYLDTIKSKHITIIAVDGLMGTGKTSTCVESLIKEHLSDVKVSMFDDEHDDEYKGNHKILISKPAVNAGGEEYGFLPGDINEKIEPTLQNFAQYFDRNHPSGFEALRLSGHIEILPLGFIRGKDAENITIVVDECQNTKELITVATRKAKDSRVFLLGDSSPFQIDREGNSPKNNGLVDIIDLLSGAPYFQYIEMKSIEHIVRSEETRDIVKRLFSKYGEDPKEWII